MRSRSPPVWALAANHRGGTDKRKEGERTTEAEVTLEELSWTPSEFFGFLRRSTGELRVLDGIKTHTHSGPWTMTIHFKILTVKVTVFFFFFWKQPSDLVAEQRAMNHVTCDATHSFPSRDRCRRSLGSDSCTGRAQST